MFYFWIQVPVVPEAIQTIGHCFYKGSSHLRRENRQEIISTGSSNRKVLHFYHPQKTFFFKLEFQRQNNDHHSVEWCGDDSPGWLVDYFGVRRNSTSLSNGLIFLAKSEGGGVSKKDEYFPWNLARKTIRKKISSGCKSNANRHLLMQSENK